MTRRLRLIGLAIGGGAVFAIAFAVTEHLLGGHTDPRGILERLFPTPSAYPDTPPDVLEARMNAIVTASPISRTFRIDGCAATLSSDRGRESCDVNGPSYWRSERTFDLRLLRTAPGGVEVSPVSDRPAEIVRIPNVAEAAERLKAIHDLYDRASHEIIRRDQARGNNLTDRMDRLRAAAAALDDRLFERFAKTVRYCSWGDVIRPQALYGNVTVFVTPGEGAEFVDLLHAYKVARCPFAPDALTVD